MPTIKDVAKKANVSIATVSLVIHNNNRISPKTKRRVQKAIDDLSYHPTRSARGLVSQKSGNIGFILTEDHFTRSEPFYSQIFLGTEFIARDYEYYILLTTITPNFSEEDRLPRFVLENNVDGIILAGKVPDLLIERLQEYKLPLAFVDYYPSTGNFPVVMIDNINAGMQATQHLIDCNHTKIAFLAGDFEHPSIHERFQGYKMALEKAGITFDERNVISDLPYPSRYPFIKSMS
jgi:LacI family transcriptional regulator